LLYLHQFSPLFGTVNALSRCHCAILIQDTFANGSPISIDYRLLVDNLTTAILLVDSKLNIFYLNSSCEALFDISLLRASGQPALNLLHAPNDEFNTEEALLNTLNSGQHYTVVIKGQL
jgi:PAS domain-containing protein